MVLTINLTVGMMSELSQTVTSQINKIQEDCAKMKPLVCIRCITFNHEPYIRDALEGFVMQKTNFPFVAIVHDDASADGTADIIREYAEKYPDIIKPIYETENQYSKRDGSLARIMNKVCEATGAKYIAMCEGDDYWTDPHKLQKQVDFLESHPDYAMCCGKAYKYNQELQRKVGMSGSDKCSFDDLIESNGISTLTTLFNASIYRDYSNNIKPEEHHWSMGDKPIWLYMALISKIKYMDCIFGVYRILNNSASHFSNFEKWINFRLSSLKISMYFLEFSHKKSISINERYQVYKLMNAVVHKDSNKVILYKNKIKTNYKFGYNKNAIWILFILLFPKLTTYVTKIYLMNKNKY